MTRLLLPVADSTTLRETVTYALESTDESVEELTVRVVYLPELRTDPNLQRSYALVGDELLDRVVDWVENISPKLDAEVEIETAIIEAESTLYTPIDVAEVILDDIEVNRIDRVVLDPSYGPHLEAEFINPIERLLLEESPATVEVAPFTPDRGLLPGSLDLPRVGFIFGISYLFYLILAGGISPYALVTGAITAGIVTATVGAITLWYPPGVRYTPMRFLRALVFIPYLLLEITRANIDVARVILHPDLPIDTRVVRYRPSVYGPFPLTTLANSITLTPGTLSMRIDRGELLVHTLTEDARTGLAGGALERAVRFLFFGRLAMRVASPAERGDITVSDPPPEEGS